LFTKVPPSVAVREKNQELARKKRPLQERKIILKRVLPGRERAVNTRGEKSPWCIVKNGTVKKSGVFLKSNENLQRFLARKNQKEAFLKEGGSPALTGVVNNTGKIAPHFQKPKRPKGKSKGRRSGETKIC